MVSASDMNRHTFFLFPYKSRSITVIRASSVRSSSCIQSLRSLSSDSLQPLPKLVFQTARASVSSFKSLYQIAAYVFFLVFSSLFPSRHFLFTSPLNVFRHIGRQDANVSVNLLHYTASHPGKRISKFQLKIRTFDTTILGNAFGSRRQEVNG
jgi:hypothetical protein